MERILDVRFTGNIHERKGDARSPESFPLPACMASLAEALGIDPAWIEIEAHGRKWSKRTLYDDVLACTGMAFGLLWHDEACHSCLDLTQVNPHDRTIALAFDRIGYGHEVVEKAEGNYGFIKERIVSSIDAGKPVLTFGLIGPPECGIICGYGDSGDTLYGWSHFQSHDPAHCHANGMFKADAGYGWYGRAWKFVFCGERKGPADVLEETVRRGLGIMGSGRLSGYAAGDAAYEAWVRYVTDAALGSMDDAALRGRYRLHHDLVGNHAEARAYLGGYLRTRGDVRLEGAADLFGKIHDTCWKVWDVGGGLHAEDGHRCLSDAGKRGEIARLIRLMRSYDASAMGILTEWLG